MTNEARIKMQIPPFLMLEGAAAAAVGFSVTLSDISPNAMQYLLLTKVNFVDSQQPQPAFSP